MLRKSIWTIKKRLEKIIVNYRHWCCVNEQPITTVTETKVEHATRVVTTKTKVGYVPCGFAGTMRCSQYVTTTRWEDSRFDRSIDRHLRFLVRKFTPTFKHFKFQTCLLVLVMKWNVALVIYWYEKSSFKATFRLTFFCLGCGKLSQFFWFGRQSRFISMVT